MTLKCKKRTNIDAVITRISWMTYFLSLWIAGVVSAVRVGGLAIGPAVAAVEMRVAENFCLNDGPGEDIHNYID